MNFDRFSSRFELINSIGRSEKEGITRLSLTKEDMEARAVLKGIFGELGLEITEDGVGNIWARKEGTDNSLPKIITGSHIDTVPNGGAYDGTLGVLAAVECLAMMKDAGFENRRPIEIVSFSTEESSRFNISTMGSKMVTGILKASDLSNYEDKDGKKLGRVLTNRGFDPAYTETIKPDEIKAFLELHIEQGPVLENRNIDIGAVTEIAAPTRLIIDINGEPAHSGSCPMEYRKDALVAASEIIIEVEKSGFRESSKKTVATVGKIEVSPGSMNVVPGQVKIFVDIRGIDNDSILHTLNSITDSTNRICRERKIKNKVEVLCQETPVALDPKLLKVIEKGCERLELSSLKLPSGAGHDTMNMATKVPSGLIFVPCIGGISHDKNENMRKIDIENGVNVLFECLCELSK